MSLVNIELGKWIYLIIYLFLPTLTIIYLIRTFGLKVNDDQLTTARKKIEQANYWIDIALNTIQDQANAKNITSLDYTVLNYLNGAAKLLADEDPADNEVQILLDALDATAKKWHAVKKAAAPSSPMAV